jgi:AcrR family transcriptional regulator
MARSPGRPKTEGGPVITRADLLAVAARIIGKYGFDRASIRLIAKEAGVSYGTVQYNFATKTELWEAVVDEIIVPALAKSRDALSSTTIGLLVEERIRHRLKAAITRPGLSAAVLADRSEGSRERLAYLADALAEMLEISRKRMRTLQVTGQLGAFDVDALMVVFGILIPSLSSYGLAMKLLIDVDIEVQEEREQLIIALTDILLYGILPRESQARPSQSESDASEAPPAE